MKYFKLVVIIIFSTLLSACEMNQGDLTQTENQNSFNLANKIEVVDGQNKFSKMFIKLGAEEINIERTDDKLTFRFETRQNISNIKPSLLDELKLEFHIDNEILFLKGDEEYGVTLVDDSPYIMTSQKSGFLKEFDKSKFNEKLTILLFALNEITTGNEYKYKSNEGALKSIAAIAGDDCSLWNQFIVYSIAGSESTAEARFGGEEEAEIVAEEEESSGTTCTKWGDIDTSCAYDEHACVSTQYYCCE